MHSTKKGSFCATSSHNQENQPPGDDEEIPSEEASWSHLQTKKFWKRSREAVSPSDIPEYREVRAREYPRQSGIKDERERSSYHQERLRTRGHEALTPGEGQVVRGLRFIKFHDTGTRREKIGSFTKRVVHPETGEVAWTVPTRWHKKAYQMVPRAVTYTSALSPTEKQVLSVLYDSACPWTFHVKGKFKVQGLSQSYIASAVGRSQPQVSRILQSLEAKLFVKRSDEGREDASCPYTYHLASYENGAWTYPALHRRSGRARLQWYAGMSTTELNWHAAVTKAVRRRKPKRKGKRIDEAAEKLQRDQQRKRTSETGLRGTEEIFGPGSIVERRCSRPSERKLSAAKTSGAGAGATVPLWKRVDNFGSPVFYVSGRYA